MCRRASRPDALDHFSGSNGEIEEHVFIEGANDQENLFNTFLALDAGPFELPLIIGEERILPTSQTTSADFVPPSYLVVEIDDGLHSISDSSLDFIISSADSFHDLSIGNKYESKDGYIMRSVKNIWGKGMQLGIRLLLVHLFLYSFFLNFEYFGASFQFESCSQGGLYGIAQSFGQAWVSSGSGLRIREKK